MGISQQFFALLVTLSIHSILFTTNSVEKASNTTASFLDVSEVVAATKFWQSSLSAVQEQLTEKKNQSVLVETLNTTYNNQLIKNHQQQSRRFLVGINTTTINEQRSQPQDKNKPVLVGSNVTDSNLQGSNVTDSSNLQKMLKEGSIHYILGVSTGHSGSTTSHRVLKGGRCPWKRRAKFELREPTQKAAQLQPQNSESDHCAYTRDVLIPFLDQQRNGATWIDIGHFHNRGPILECLASLVGPKIAFVRIRRNRHDIASSFQKNFQTPCFPVTTAQQQQQYPEVSYCPGDTATPVSLSVNSDTWNKFTSFQQFLWLADELEMRFHKLQTNYPESKYLEMTWSNSQELTKALQDVRLQLGCGNNFTNIPNLKKHMRHHVGTRNCTKFISEDLEYRTLAQYSSEQERVLFHQNPQAVNIDECIETKEQIQNTIMSLSSKERFQQWVYK